MKILLVDDEPFALRLLQRQLEGLGHRGVVCCEHARDALARIEAQPGGFELIFCDLNMPGMDGVELVRHLVRAGYGGGLVLVSGEDERVLQTARRLAEAHRLKVLGALIKPVSREQLRAVLGTRSVRRGPSAADGAKRYGPAELGRAIAGGELVVHYQPKVEVSTGRLAGVEALVRWSHPRDGLVYPDRFVPVAEEHGLIDGLTRAVVAAALAQARAWRDAGTPLHVAVNVSMDNLGALDFPDRVAAAAERAGVPVTALVLEVTESRVMRDPVAALDSLTRLRLKRIGLAIDDFGTGHSTLVQLRDIPFDELKLDRGFVHGAGQDSALGAIFGGNLHMARQLGMRTVAEGVEDRDDWSFVQGSGCDLAQGYFIARPMPASDLPRWTVQWEARRRELVAEHA